MKNSIPTTENWQDQIEYIATKQGFDFRLNEEGDAIFQKRSPEGKGLYVKLYAVSDYEDARQQLYERLVTFNTEEEFSRRFGTKKVDQIDLQELETFQKDFDWCDRELHAFSDAVDHYNGYTLEEYRKEAVLEEALERSFEECNLNDYSFSNELKGILLYAMSDYDDPETKLQEICQHGCISGVLPQFIATYDCKEFYQRHFEDIENYIAELEDDLGEAIKLDTPRYEKATWLIAEECSSRVYDVFSEQRESVLVEMKADEEQNQSEHLSEIPTKRDDLFQRLDLAKSKATDPDTLDKLAKFLIENDKDIIEFNVLEQIAKNDNTNSDTLRYISDHIEFDVDRVIVQLVYNDNTPNDILGRYMDHPCEEVRYGVASRSTDPNVLAHLSNDDDPEVLGLVACNPNKTYDTYQKLLNYPDNSQVRFKAESHPQFIDDKRGELSKESKSQKNSIKPKRKGMKL